MIGCMSPRLLLPSTIPTNATFTTIPIPALSSSVPLEPYDLTFVTSRWRRISVAPCGLSVHPPDAPPHPAPAHSAHRHRSCLGPSRLLRGFSSHRNQTRVPAMAWDLHELPIDLFRPIGFLGVLQTPPAHLLGSLALMVRSLEQPPFLAHKTLYPIIEVSPETSFLPRGLSPLPCPITLSLSLPHPILAFVTT